MKIKTKVAIAFFAILLGVVAVVIYFNSPLRKVPFRLIDQVEESEMAFHADLNKIFLESDKYIKEASLTLTERVISSQVKQQLLKSGLRLEETYITYAFIGNQKGAFYAEINDTTLFKEAFKRLTNYFKLEPLEGDPSFYHSSTGDISIEKHPEYVKINWGKNVAHEKPNKVKKSSPLFKSLLKTANYGVVNTTGTPSLDTNDYATFTYEYDQILSITANWKVTKTHPLKSSQTTIPVYPSLKNNVQAYCNIDIENLLQQINPYLRQEGTTFLEKLSPATQEVLQLWNGQASIQMGGKTTKETIQYVTEFDDDFNQIEKKTVKTDSLPDLGLYWGTNHPKKSFDALVKMPNVKMQKEQLQLALFPPLNVLQSDHSLKASATDVDFKEEKSKYIVFINSESPIVQGELTIQEISKDVVQLNITMKNPRIPKKMNISSFW